jgi:hypothetical protein
MQRLRDPYLQGSRPVSRGADTQSDDSGDTDIQSDTNEDTLDATDNSSEEDNSTQPKTNKKKKSYDPDIFNFIIFDFETVAKIDGDKPEMVHKVNVACAEAVCNSCCESEEPFCDNCGEKQVTFYGTNSLNEFCEWLFNDRKDNWLAFAHNFQDKYSL